MKIILNKIPVDKYIKILNKVPDELVNPIAIRDMKIFNLFVDLRINFSKNYYDSIWDLVEAFKLSEAQIKRIIAKYWKKNHSIITKINNAA